MNLSQALTSILQKAASECGYLDLRKVETILGESPDPEVAAVEMASQYKGSNPGK